MLRMIYSRDIGAAFPVYARRHRGMGVPEWAFFAAKYFGSGVIIATAFIHVCADSVDYVYLLIVHSESKYNPFNGVEYMRQG